MATNILAPIGVSDSIKFYTILLKSGIYSMSTLAEIKADKIAHLPEWENSRTKSVYTERDYQSYVNSVTALTLILDGKGE